MNNDIKLYIDSREKKNRVQKCKTYFKKEQIECIEKQLEYGDYLFYRTEKYDIEEAVVFEYKTIHDFMYSIKNNSLFEEVMNQTLRYDFSYLIIEGTVEEYCRTAFRNPKILYKWSYDEYKQQQTRIYEGAVSRILTICPIIYIMSEEEVFKKMQSISDKIMNLHPYQVFGSKRRLKHNNELIALLSHMFGVKTSEKIVEELKITCLKDLLTLSKEDLLSIRGIGKKKADKLMKFIKGENDIKCLKQ